MVVALPAIALREAAQPHGPLPMLSVLFMVRATAQPRLRQPRQAAACECTKHRPRSQGAVWGETPHTQTQLSCGPDAHTPPDTHH